MTRNNIPSTDAVLREISTPGLTRGSAVGRRVEIKLEDHSVETPFQGTLTDYIQDREYEGKGWYLVELDISIPVLGEPVTEVLIFPKGAHLKVPQEPEYD